MGAKGTKERPSKRKAEACRANAARPRGRWAGTAEREVLEAAKAIIRECLPEGMERLAAIVRDPDTPPELLLAVLRFFADRGGLPVQSQVDAAPPPAPQPWEATVRATASRAAALLGRDTAWSPWDENEGSPGEAWARAGLTGETFREVERMESDPAQALTYCRALLVELRRDLDRKAFKAG